MSAAVDWPAIQRAIAEAAKPIADNYGPEGFKDSTVLAAARAQSRAVASLSAADAATAVEYTLDDVPLEPGWRGTLQVLSWQGRNDPDAPSVLQRLFRRHPELGELKGPEAQAFFDEVCAVHERQIAIRKRQAAETAATAAMLHMQGLSGDDKLPRWLQ